MEKSKIFLDLSKCTEEEQRHLEKLTGFKISYIKRYPYLQIIFSGWNQSDFTHLEGKTELTYPEFIKLFEGGDRENNGWIPTEIKPDKFQDVILYREDAGVFTGYYGNLAESLSEMAIEQLYNEGVSEEEMWEEQFFYFGIEGNGILEGNEKPTDWMPLPELPKF